MNPLEALNLVAEAIIAAEPMNGRRYQIWYDKEGFHCTAVDHRRLVSAELGVFGGSELQKGLCSSNWNQIENRIGELMMKGVICLNQSKR